MDKKTYSIGILTVTAVILFVANFTTPARGIMAVKDRDYQVITARVQQGGDALYVVDNRSGQMIVFTYDPSSRSVKPRAVRPVVEAFAR